MIKKGALSTLLFSSTLGLAFGCGGDDTSPNGAESGGQGGSGGSAASSGSSSTGGSSGGTGGSSQGSGGSGNASGAESCAEVEACCAELTSDLAQACEIAAASEDENTCLAAILSFQTQGYCSDEEVEDPTGGLPEVTLDGAWDAATSAGGGARAFENFLIQACNGDVIGLWRTEGDQPEIASVRYSGETGTWTPLGMVDENNGLYAASPKLAVNSDCDAIALWLDGLDVLNGNDEYTLTARRLSGDTWGTPVVLDENFQSEMSRLTLFVDPSGIGELGYDTSAPDPSAVARRLLGESSAEPKLSLNTLKVSGAAFGMLPSGDGLLFLSEYDDQQVAPVDVFLRSWTRSPSGEWSDASELETVPDARHYSMKIIPANDRFYGTWLTSTGEHFFGVQVPGETMAPLELPAGFELDDARFAASGEVLFAYGFGEDGAQAARFTVAGGWEEPTLLNAEKHTLNNGFTIVVDGAGRATAVYWMPEVGVFANRFTPEEGWAGPHAIDIHGSNASIAVDEAGRVFVSYLVFESTGFLSGTNNVTLRRFVPDELL